MNLFELRETIYNNKVYINICRVINFLLLCSIILDPTNSILHVKIPLFVLFCFLRLPAINFKYILAPVLLFVSFGISFTVNYLLHENLDIGLAILIFKAFLFIAYLFFVVDDRLKLFKSFYYICLILAIFQSILWGLELYSHPIERFFYDFFCTHNSFVIQTHRAYYGIPVFQVFYKTCPLVVLTFSVSLYYFFKKPNIKYFVHSLIFAMCLFTSGTRANWLCLLLLVYLEYIYFNYFLKHRKVWPTILLIFGLICFSALIIFLLTRSEHSQNIKSGHLKSFIALYKSNWLKTLTIGFGPGKRFFSIGSNSEVSITELTYCEYIKGFGLFGLLLLLIVLLYPLKTLYLNKDIDFFAKYSIFWGYLAFLFEAGTNPLLISSTGFVLVCTIYYISEINLDQEMAPHAPCLLHHRS